mmetsp:Transcript_20122/g.29413  ORF Transcript_20122/g.29413 Transcript_20122/m.29413 type:complete len:225 (-) Transcript_20122:278-952(-)
MPTRGPIMRRPTMWRTISRSVPIPSWRVVPALRISTHFLVASTMPAPITRWSVVFVPAIAPISHPRMIVTVSASSIFLAIYAEVILVSSLSLSAAAAPVSISASPAPVSIFVSASLLPISVPVPTPAIVAFIFSVSVATSIPVFIPSAISLFPIPSISAGILTITTAPLPISIITTMASRTAKSCGFSIFTGLSISFSRCSRICLIVVFFLILIQVLDILAFNV